MTDSKTVEIKWNQDTGIQWRKFQDVQTFNFDELLNSSRKNKIKKKLARRGIEPADR